MCVSAFIRLHTAASPSPRALHARAEDAAPPLPMAAACGDEERRGAERVSVCIGVHTRLEQPRRRRQAAQQRCIKELLGLWV